MFKPKITTLRIKLNLDEQLLLARLCALYGLPVSHSGMLAALDTALQAAANVERPRKEPQAITQIEANAEGKLTDYLNFPLTPERRADLLTMRDRINASPKTALMFCCRLVVFAAAW